MDFKKNDLVFVETDSTFFILKIGSFTNDNKDFKYVNGIFSPRYIEQLDGSPLEELHVYEGDNCFDINGVMEVSATYTSNWQPIQLLIDNYDLNSYKLNLSKISRHVNTYEFDIYMDIIGDIKSKFKIVK